MTGSPLIRKKRHESLPVKGSSLFPPLPSAIFFTETLLHQDPIQRVIVILLHHKVLTVEEADVEESVQTS